MIMLPLLSMTLSLIFLVLKHPLGMGITIIAQTMIIAMMTGLMLKSFWFSYIIVITMLSGMLVLFIYMASVASNEKFNMSYKLITMSVMLALTSLILQMIMNEQNEFMNIEASTEKLSLNVMFNCKFKMITITMVLYLLFTMITVSFIVNISEGPLRMKY
uniref:NADH dehydrogenase subunit 6 n=1 Tax=Cloresmus pulchellus TaxID=2575654 RepID=A0A4D6X0D9_9HEMI|nr:NADH dehydrogenase subunit 6 [Cloresmus pulchellus]QCI09323.1 NADH dehydrogenase subunit 6 [Cloresmus pulchellus]